jgi:hypothetical protein
MYRSLLLSLTLAFVALPAFAGSTYPNEDIEGYAGACQPASDLDSTRLLRDPLWIRNHTLTGKANVICSPAVDTSQQGTTAFGAVLNNTQGITRTVTCVAKISQVSGGTVKIPRSVIVDPRGHARIGWYAQDLDFKKVLIGGQAGFTCTLPPGMALQWVWTTSVSN